MILFFSAVLFEDSVVPERLQPQPHICCLTMRNVLSGRKVSVIALAAIPGFGKTTRLRLMHCLMQAPSAHPKVIAIDMSEVLDWGMNSESEAGDALRAAVAQRAKGKLVDDEIVIPIALEWLECTLAQHPYVELILWSGFPRSIMQSALLAYFSAYAFIHFDVAPEVAEERYVGRWIATPPHKRRIDDPPTIADVRKKFRDRLGEYEKHTAPTLRLHAPRVIVIPHTMTIAEQMREAFIGLMDISRSPVPPLIMDEACANFDNASHDFHIEAGKIEHPEPVPVAIPA